MTKKQGLRVVLFLALLVVVCAILNSIFVKGSAYGTTARFRAFYNTEKKNTWDGVFLVSSVVERAWAAPLAWHEKGLSLYPMSTDSQPIIYTTNLIDEVKKRQDIKFAVIDIRVIRSTKDELKDFKIRRLTDNLRFSKNKDAILKKTFEYIEKYNKNKSLLDDKLSFYIPFMKYHSRWNSLSLGDLIKPKTEMKGVYEDSAFKIMPIEAPELTVEAGGLSEKSREIMNEILDYGKKTGLQLIFTSMPAPLSKKEQRQINEAFGMVREAGYPCLNFNTKEVYDKLQIDFTKDFYDHTHVNSKGARKVTAYLADFIAGKVSFTDKRGEKEYKSWDAAWDYYVSYYEKGWAESGQNTQTP